MTITDHNAVRQALANIKLESLNLSKEVVALLNEALTDKTIDTTLILNSLRG